MAKTIGIDLGTTNSLCAVFEDGRPRLVQNALGEVITPSVVGMLKDGQILVGKAARELRVTQPKRCAWAFKRWMGTDHKFKLGKKIFTATELSGMVLSSMKKDAESYLETEVKCAVISVPAYFNDQQRKMTRLAGELAELKVLRITNEPTAAALTYGFHEREADKKLLVFDLGGGTFDVTLMEIFEGTVEIIASSGENFLGGEDFTNRIVSWVLRRQGINLETAELKTPLLVSRLTQECEQVKTRLSKKETAIIRLPDEKGNFGKKNEAITLTRECFQEISRSLADRIMTPIARVLRDGHCAIEELSDIILVGGATRMPLIEKIVESELGKKPQCEFDPDQVVALGMAVQAALTNQDRSVEDMVVTDVCPFTLGISIVKRFDKRIERGYYLPIIYRNTTIPVSREEKLSTVQYGQREVKIKIYQGEARKVEKNMLLGEFTVKDIPPGPPGKTVYVRFTYDLNGILDVEAYVPETKKSYQTVLTNHVKGLSQREIEKAIKKMQSLKFFPRHDVAHQDLLQFAERVVGEINPYQRENLERALDQFEAAMTSDDREYFSSMREQLLILLSSLGFEYTEH